ncbi:hypothetical protein TrVE_jg7091 [Triparma verrucosa]|uniref:Uncharacterized protein n=1 Tax=Triparma verrucosa TaxID=1606542 RepID=A0A9W7FDN2_9STRA|nr:hypothetical protein TrVE_jg7091 [Triparma verrucosa]
MHTRALIVLCFLVLCLSLSTVTAAKSPLIKGNVISNKSLKSVVASTSEVGPTFVNKMPNGGAAVAKAAMPDSVKLLIGAGGIYSAFLYYGSLQEDVFRYTAADGTQFKQAWLLQVLEALANVIVGGIGMQLTGATKGIPKKMFAVSGFTQVSAKAFTSLALANGLSFPVATLAKSGKMVPVMIGSLLLGGASYSVREYLQVAAIIAGTAIVSMGKKKGAGAPSSVMGVTFILLSLVMDGVTGGVQKKLKAETKKVGISPKPYDFMFWTNVFMCLTAIVISGGLGEVTSGLSYITSNPEIMSKIIKFALCSAAGQSFIFFTIANFDPLVCTTVTTTRKIFSVLLSIFLKGHQLSGQGWGGIALACGGILAEMEGKMNKAKKA